jgi:hypothetical protein
MIAPGRKWMPLVVCCLPGLVVVVLVGVGAVAGGALGVSFNGPVGTLLLALAFLACPLHMGWMMWRLHKQQAAASHAGMRAACCLPSQEASATEPTSSERLVALRAERTALERELAELQAQ